jgi:DNA-binding response OmpR family regulator
MDGESAKSKQHEPAILIIDDDSNNLAITSGLLGELSYTIYVAEDGESGIRRALLTNPDLILLDVMMPGMDGFETCRRMKRMEALHDIPVIFMTALAEMEQKVRGFEAGAVDYITKPIQREEVLARVGVHLRLRHLAKELKQSNELLERRVEERTEALAQINEALEKEVAERRLAQETLAIKQGELEALNASLERRVAEEVEKNLQKDRILFHNARLSAMGELLNNVAHQWRQPLNSIALMLQGCILEAREAQLERDSVKSCVDKCMEQIGYLSKTINLFQSFFMPEEEPREFDPYVTVEKAVSLVRASYERDSIELRVMNSGAVTMRGFCVAFSQAFLSILNNAKEVLLERGTPHPVVEIVCSSRDGSNLIAVSDNGGGIDEGIMDKIFDPYFSTKFGSQGTGLGLYMAKMVIEKNMQGRLSARNTAEGAVFIIELPVQPEQ